MNSQSRLHLPLFFPALLLLLLHLSPTAVAATDIQFPTIPLTNPLEPYIPSYLGCQELFPVSATTNLRDHSHYFNQSPPEIQLLDAITELRQMGYSILALAIDLRLPEFIGLRNFTAFAPDDNTIFSGAEGFVGNIEYHIVPGKRLMFTDMMDFDVGTEISTMEKGRNLIVTGNSTLFSINNVRIKHPDRYYNGLVSVHQILIPFPPMTHI